eukprot:1048850-Amphidinium_carterae.2
MGPSWGWSAVEESSPSSVAAVASVYPLHTDFDHGPNKYLPTCSFRDRFNFMDRRKRVKIQLHIWLRFPPWPLWLKALPYPFLEKPLKRRRRVMPGMNLWRDAPTKRRCAARDVTGKKEFQPTKACETTAL